MKKSIITAAGIIFLFCQSFSQVNFGAKAGLNISTVKDDFWKADNIRPGFNGGLFAEIKISKTFFIQPELLYSAKGYKFISDALQSSGTLSLHYISVPLLGGFRPSDKLAVLFGPEISFLVMADSKYDGSNNNITGVYSRVDAAIDLGITYNIVKRLGIVLCYSYGLQVLDGAVKTSTIINYVGVYNASNRVFQVGIFYRFSKKE